MELPSWAYLSGCICPSYSSELNIVTMTALPPSPCLSETQNFSWFSLRQLCQVCKFHVIIIPVTVIAITVCSSYDIRLRVALNYYYLNYCDVIDLINRSSTAGLVLESRKNFIQKNVMTTLGKARFWFLCACLINLFLFFVFSINAWLLKAYAIFLMSTVLNSFSVSRVWPLIISSTNIPCLGEAIANSR